LQLQENAFALWLPEKCHSDWVHWHLVYAFSIFPTKDGYIAIATMGELKISGSFLRRYRAFDIIDDKRFETDGCALRITRFWNPL
jgi:hypothetical protein